jgi:hypothetical protein
VLPSPRPTGSQVCLVQLTTANVFK